MEIKPIETMYNGYRFRSRLEARWAVFFDAAGIEYQYEPEGFEVNFDGKIYRYLPDFYLPQFDKYVEVKPNKQKLLEDSEKLSVMIDWGATPISRGLIILGQIPYYANADGIPEFNYIFWSDGVASSYVSFLFSMKIGELFVSKSIWDIQSAPDFPKFAIDEFWKNSNDLYRLSQPSIEYTIGNHVFVFDLSDMEFAITNKILIPAFTKARQARFEHGECP